MTANSLNCERLLPAVRTLEADSLLSAQFLPVS